MDDEPELLDEPELKAYLKCNIFLGNVKLARTLCQN